ncbi:ribonuclease III [Candidatus Parcubacteria bacterium]|nr:ribonuclease III [Candidatus Parcubacteria bacterium]
MDYNKIEEKIGVKFNDRNMLIQAFTHRSFLNENKDKELKHNERLEFLGDAVLELVTTDYLFRTFPDRHEGDLTSFRAALVNTQSISDAATNLGFNDYLRLSKGESKDVGRARSYILANTFESVIGAIYIDQGYDAAAKFIAETLLPSIDQIIKEGTWIDAKSKLQEVVQEKHSLTPSYETIKEEGPDHDKNFTVAVYFGDKEIDTGSGKSKQEAEQDVARKILKREGIL